MRRKSEFDQSKLMQLATNKAALYSDCSSFPIEQVKLTFSNFEGNKERINIYIPFEDIALIAEDMNSGRLIKKAEQEYVQLVMGGGQNKTFSTGFESRTLTVKVSNGKVFLNAKKQPGEQKGTGIIVPVKGETAEQVTVSGSVDDMRKFFIYTNQCVQAYLAKHVYELVKKAQEKFFEN